MESDKYSLEHSYADIFCLLDRNPEVGDNVQQVKEKY